jgi:hypothetical protein
MQKSLWICLACVLFVYGCQTTQSAVNTQLTSYFNIEPPLKNQRYVYVQVQNGSGQDMKFQEKIATTIGQKGYTITTDPQQANYVLQANVIHAGDIENDVLQFAYKTDYGSRIVKSGPKEDMIGSALNKLTGSMSAKSKCIIMDLKVLEWQNLNGDRKRVNAFNNKKTRIVSGVSGRNLPETVMDDMSNEVIQKVTAFF